MNNSAEEFSPTSIPTRNRAKAMSQSQVSVEKGHKRPHEGPEMGLTNPDIDVSDVSTIETPQTLNVSVS